MQHIGCSAITSRCTKECRLCQTINGLRYLFGNDNLVKLIFCFNSGLLSFRSFLSSSLFLLFEPINLGLRSRYGFFILRLNSRISISFGLLCGFCPLLCLEIQRHNVNIQYINLTIVDQVRLVTVI